LALSAAIVPLLGAAAEPQALAWALLRRFGALAAGSLAALLVSGLFMSGQQVASIDAALTTLYGRALLLKLGLVGVVALIGLCNAATLHPRVAAALRRPFARYRAAPAACMAEAPSIQGRLARWVRLETIGAAAVLLLAALLTAAQPARGPAFDPPAPETPGVALTQADDLVMTLALKPNRPGQNFVSLNVIDTRRPAPAPIAEVAVQFQSPGAQEISRLVARPIGTGRYEVTDDSIVGSGDMPIHVTVRRAGLPDVNATLPWTVLPAGDRPRPVLVSNQPLAPALSLAALLIGLLVIAALAATRLRGSIVGSARALAGEFAPARRSAPPPERPTPAEERVAQ
jgi:copper transport protein